MCPSYQSTPCTSPQSFLTSQPFRRWVKLHQPSGIRAMGGVRASCCTLPIPRGPRDPPVRGGRDLPPLVPVAQATTAMATLRWRTSGAAGDPPLSPGPCCSRGIRPSCLHIRAMRAAAAVVVVGGAEGRLVGGTAPLVPLCLLGMANRRIRVEAGEPSRTSMLEGFSRSPC